MNLKNSRCQRWSALRWGCSLFWTLATRTYMEGTMGQRSRWRHQNCYCCNKNYNNHNLSWLNLQIFHDLLQTKRYFHLRISGKSSPVKVSIVWAWLASLENANILIFFPFLRKCQRRRNTPCKCGDLLKSRLSIVDLQRINITDHNNQESKVGSNH